MAYQAIYRKWRPLSFEDVVGQRHITDTLKTELITNKIAHAYLFCGTRGTGKTTTAKILSRAINCQNILPNGNPCNECESCKGILAGTIMDVTEIDAASNNGVDNIRELRDEIAYTPSNVKYKIYIIDEVHMLSTGAFNALLKTLEEPPSHAVFILATTEPHKIPATIQSRCQRFDFHRISVKNIAGRAGEIARKDNIKISEDAIRLVAELGDGSMRDALSILDLCSGITGEITRTDIENVAGVASKEVLYNIAKALMSGDISNAIICSDDMVSSGRDVNNLLDEILAYFRELLLCKIMPNPERVLDKYEEDINKSKSLVANVDNETLLHIIRTLSDTVSVCKTSTNPLVMLEAAFVKICKPELDTTTEAFAARLRRLEAAMVTGIAPLIPTMPAKTEQIATSNPQEPPFEEEYVAETQEYVAEDDEYVAEIEDYIAPIEDEYVPPIEQQPDQPMQDEPAQDVRESVYNASDNEYNNVLKAISVDNPGIYNLLTGTKSEIINDVTYIVFENEIFRDTVLKTPVFVETLETALKSKIKLVTTREFTNRKTVKDPFDDILALDKDMEQMTIF